MTGWVKASIIRLPRIEKGKNEKRFPEPRSYISRPDPNVSLQIENHINIPLLHIADATGEEIKKAGLDTVGLLGTRFTMEQDFYRGRLAERYDLKVLIPDESERESVHRVIYEELCLGKVRESSRDQ